MKSSTYALLLYPFIAALRLTIGHMEQIQTLGVGFYNIHGEA